MQNWSLKMISFSDGTGSAVIGDGRGGPGHVNGHGMPGKKSQSTSKLSAKGIYRSSLD